MKTGEIVSFQSIKAVLMNPVKSLRTEYQLIFNCNNLFTNQESSQNYLLFIAFIISLVRLSALEFCNEMTAHIAAGTQPIIVICKIKQIIPVNIFPRRKNERNGKNIAMRVI
jgi:hypothetical protein